MVGESPEINRDLVQLTRLALGSQQEDLRLFVARLVRKYRATAPDFAADLDRLLRDRAERRGNPLRKALSPATSEDAPPLDGESRLALLKVVRRPSDEPPLLSPALAEVLEQLIRERQQTSRLSAAGCGPMASEWSSERRDQPSRAN